MELKERIKTPRGIGIIAAAFIIIMGALQGCIKNDIPFPRITQNIVAIAARGESKSAYIDSIAFEAHIYLDETTDIENVTFSEYAISPGGTSDPDLLEGSYDLTKPLYVTLTRFQEYVWEVTAYQDIERYFQVEGEIGESTIDPVARRVIVNVAEGTDLSSLVLQRVKLGPRDITTMVPDIKPGRIDLRYPLRVEVTAHGRTDVWTIYAQYVETLVNTTQVDAWSEVVWAYGACPSDMKGGFQYRVASSSSWIDLPAQNVTQTQGSFSAYIPHLKPLTEYVVRAVADKEVGNEIRVTTESTADIPNGGFEDWWYNGKIWFPYPEGGPEFWDTGNTGAATLGQNNVMPTEHTSTGSGKAAQLDTRFVGIAGIGKLAAGSIFTGRFKKVDGTNGILDFGRTWNLRPTRLRGYFQYKTAPINYASTEFKSLIGQPDTCHIYVALTDWTEPYEIRTNPRNQHLFDKNSPSIIAYGELLYSGTMDGYQEFEIKLNYRDTSRVPTYLQITCASSKYGDYFTGGAGATLYVDQFSFDWDLP